MVGSESIRSLRELTPGEIEGSAWDVAVVGAGHNGLTAAAYLAMAGLSVIVLERRDRIGGAVTVEEPWPGYRVSPCAYVLGLLHEQVAADLALERRGLTISLFDPQLYVPLDDGTRHVEWRSRTRTLDSLARWAPSQVPGYEAMAALEDHIFTAIRGDGADLDDLWLRIDPPARDEVEARLADPAAVAAVFELSIVDYLRAFFSDERIVDAIAGQGVIGETVSPFHPGTAWIRLHHGLGRLAGDEGSWGVVHGGIGMVTAALARAATEAGALVVTDAPVASVRPGRGVELAAGGLIRAANVVSNADPLVTLGLVGDAATPELRSRLDHELVGASAKVTFSLTGLPDFGGEDATAAMVNVGADADRLHEAAATASGGELPEWLWAELYLQTAYDPTVAPPGKHLLSCFVQYVPYSLTGGWDAAARRAVADRVTAQIERHAPRFGELVEHVEITVPPDIERRIGLTGGHIFQGECLPRRMWADRAPYQTAVDGLWLCGASTHPGGSVIAVNGRNAAMALLRTVQD